MLDERREIRKNESERGIVDVGEDKWIIEGKEKGLRIILKKSDKILNLRKLVNKNDKGNEGEKKIEDIEKGIIKMGKILIEEVGKKGKVILM